VPGDPSRWKTETIDVLVLERGSGDFWSLRVRGPDGKERLWVDISYAWSRGKFTYVEPDVENQAPNESVVPGGVAAVLESLGFVKLLAGMPDLSKHQRVRWDVSRMHQVADLVEWIEQMSS
jgi:hypothetical protein